MSEELWQKLLVPPGNEDHIWELYHENSKLGRYDIHPFDSEILQRMHESHESLPFIGYPTTELLRTLPPLTIPLDKAILSRTTNRNLQPVSIALDTLSTLLHYAYGVTRDNAETGLPRPFRTIPSAGALYPLEIFFFSSHLHSQPPGLYHYNPTSHSIRLVLLGDHTQQISDCLVQSELVQTASLVFFITAFFDRSIFKYGDRGYRFIFLEAGHVAQNINLVSRALGLESINIGGFFDREIDTFLSFDGITQSTIYMITIGKEI